MKIPKISVIVPVYNVEKYLHKCIDSILAQTFTDFEVLLIDDGSTDNSGKICDEYAEKDDRVRVFHKENGGVSSARNLGLNNTEGEWICFIDADDFISISFLEDFYTFIQNNQCIDAIICGSNSYISDKNQSTLFSFKYGIYNIEEFISSQYLHFACWGYIFRHSLLSTNHILFNTDLCLSEDRIFILESFFCMHHIGCLDKNNYYYQYNIDSVCRSSVTQKKVISQLNATLYITRLLKKYNLNTPFKQLVKKVLKETFSNYLHLRIDLLKDYKSDKIKIISLYNNMIKYDCTFFSIFCVRYCFHMTIWLLFLKNKIKK